MDEDNRLFLEALRLHHAFQVAEAEAGYRRVLEINPLNHDAWHMLGFLAAQLGNDQAAAELIGHAVSLYPNQPEFLSNLGTVLTRLGQFDEAEANLRNGLALAPMSPALLINLGDLKKRRGEAFEAKRLFEAALESAPDAFEALNNLGVVLQSLGEVEAAVQVLNRAAAICPDHAGVHFHLAVSLDAAGRIDEAMVACRAAIRLRADYAEAWSLLGKLHHHRWELEEAHRALTKALAIQPKYLPAVLNSAMVCQSMNRQEDAVAFYRQAVALKPESNAIAIDLIHQMQWACDWEGMEELTKAVISSVERQGDEGPGEPIPPFAFLSLPLPTTSEQQCTVAKNWAKQYQTGTFSKTHTRPLPSAAAEPSSASGRGDTVAVRRDADSLHPIATASGNGDLRRRIRIGYVSADFGDHATSWLIADLFAAHDRSRFEIYGYDIGDIGGGIRPRLEKGFDKLSILKSFSHKEAAGKILDDAVDILVDLKGYTFHARPEILAMRPAPIQATFLGYPGTMGADFIDYNIVDETVVPFNRQPYYSERLIHLPGCYQVNCRDLTVDANTPVRRSQGLPESGFVFCAFNNPFKITPSVFDIWMRLLSRLPGSVLWLLGDNRFMQANLRREAERRGVSGARMLFAPRVEHSLHLARHRCADLFLDTFPYNAHTTAGDALRMGLPMVTLCGEAFASRVATSLLRTLGLEECVTESMDDYETLANSLASDAERLLRLREKIAVGVERSDLYNVQAFARKMEAAFLTMVARL